jgi:hypothetical protein
MTTEVAMISLEGREFLASQTARTLAGRGGIVKAGLKATVYWSGVGEAPSFYGWTVKRFPIERPASLSLLRVLEGTTPGNDLLFFEDDLLPCRNAVIAAATIQRPPMAGLVSFFDYRGEWKSPGFFIAPKKRDLWGSQAVLIPAHVVQTLIPALKEKIEKDRAKGNFSARGAAWDTWLGHAVEDFGFRVVHHSPSLFQHVGAKSSIANVGASHPYAKNFPGEDWDALLPCPDPVPSGKFTEYLPACQFHKVTHLNGRVCRYWPITAREERI